MIFSLCVHNTPSICISFFFFFNDTATTEIYTLSLHDALPILSSRSIIPVHRNQSVLHQWIMIPGSQDRKSTRLNSSHMSISYAVFCLKKKKIRTPTAFLLQYCRYQHTAPFANANTTTRQRLFR